VPDENRYAVKVEREDTARWRVLIVDPAGTVVSERACGHEAEARTYASTVRQHIYWLSEGKFRQYYRLPEPAES
jgi:RPA family protein